MINNLHFVHARAKLHRAVGSDLGVLALQTVVGLKHAGFSTDFVCVATNDQLLAALVDVPAVFSQFTLSLRDLHICTVFLCFYIFNFLAIFVIPYTRTNVKHSN